MISARIDLPVVSLVVVCLLPLAAQTLDTGVLGTVLDPEDGTVPAASVTISNTAMGVSRIVKTTAEGKYEVRYLVPGEYSIEVRATGLRSERTGVVIPINQQVRIDFALQVGDVQQT